MMENQNNALIVLILLIVIGGQGISYIALDGILKTILADRPTQIIVTLSGNEVTQIPEIVTETGQIDDGKDKVVDFMAAYKMDVNEPSTATTQTYTQEGILNPIAGVNYFNGHKETYYNLPMDGVLYLTQARGIPGEYFVRDDGVKMYRTADGEFVICAARQDLWGQIIETSLGQGIVLDTGGFAFYNPDQVDIAVTW